MNNVFTTTDVCCTNNSKSTGNITNDPSAEWWWSISYRERTSSWTVGLVLSDQSDHSLWLCLCIKRSKVYVPTCSLSLSLSLFQMHNKTNRRNIPPTNRRVSLLLLACRCEDMIEQSVRERGGGGGGGGSPLNALQDISGEKTPKKYSLSRKKGTCCIVSQWTVNERRGNKGRLKAASIRRWWCYLVLVKRRRNHFLFERLFRVAVPPSHPTSNV